MRTRFGLFCEGLLEGIWLIALIVAPLYFNFHTSNIFDPDKSSLIRGLALFMLIIYLIRLMEGSPTLKLRKTSNPSGSLAKEGKTNPKEPFLDRSKTRIHPIVIMGLIMGGCYLFSTIVSVTPHTSWWGSYSRAQGAYTLLSYVVIFFITALSLRKQVQLERMVTTIILTSFPIAIYGLSQPLRLDALPWGTDFTRRIGSTIGNPIFLGGYFIMVIPLTLVRLIHPAHKSSKIYVRGLYAFLLLLQIVCLILTQSRGPLVGLIVGLFFFFVLTALLYQRKKLALIGYGLAILLTLFLVVLNLPKTPLEPLKKTPYIGRLGQVFETESGSGKVRLLIWEGVVNMVKTGGLRNFIGFGPEMMAVLYYRHCPPELVRFDDAIKFPDRSHNELFDTLISTGFIGTFVYLCFVGIIIFYVLKWLGLIRTRFRVFLFIILCVAGSLAGIILPYLLQGSFIFSSVGIPLGLVSAAAVYILIALFQSPDKSSLGHSANTFGLILIGLASALIAHFIETQFGIAITATRTYFWLFAAMLVPTGYFIQTNWAANSSSNSSPSNSPKTPKGPERFRGDTRLDLPTVNKQSITASHPTTSLTFYALIIGFILSTVFYNLVPSLPPHSNCIISGIGEIVLILLFSVIFITTVRASKGYTTLFILSAGYVIIFAMILSLFLPPFYFLLPTPAVHLSVIPMFYLWVLLTIGLVAWSIYPKETIIGLTKKKYRLKPASPALPSGRSAGRLIRSGNLIIYVLLIGGVFIWIFYSLIRPLQGNMLYKRGSQSEKLKRWDESLSYYKQVIDRSADATYYYASMARVYMEKCDREANPEKKAQIREECKKYLLLSLEYEPLSPERNANLGRFYRKWALDSSDETERKHHFQEALKHYERAHRLTPYNPRLLNEWGELYVDMKRYKEAIEKYEDSERLDKTFAETYAHLGDAYAILNKIPEASKYYEQAARLYLTSKEKLRNPNQEILFTRTHERLIKYQPKNYLGYYNLARYWWGKKGHKRCLELAKKGRGLAPPSQQQTLDRYIQQIEQR